MRIYGAIPRASCGVILFDELRTHRSSYPMKLFLVRELAVSGVETGAVLVAGAVLVVMSYTAHGIGGGVISCGVRTESWGHCI